MFNGFCSAAFLASSSALAADVHGKLFYYYSTIPGFASYPAMTTAFVSTL